MDILKEFPKSEAQFINWFWCKYSQPPEIFEGAPFVHQCEAIWRFLGYPVNAPDSWTILQIDEHTRNVLYIYESLLIKYPEGTPNVLRALNEMSYQERRKKYSHLETPSDIRHSLNEAIVSLDKYKIVIKPLPSLRDALIMLKTIILAKVVDDNWWDCILPKNRKNEDAPF